MDTRFLPNNSHLEDADRFSELDPHLRRLRQSQFIFSSALIQEIPRDQPGIISLGGGRQVGKTTLLKQWMADLLQHGVVPEAICFFSGELIADHQALYTLVFEQVKQMPADRLKYLIIDEITYINDWDKTVKYLADIGALESTVLVLSSSDLVLMQDARKRFPGRRGNADKVDFHYYPLSFKEFLQLKNMLPETNELQGSQREQQLTILYDQFEQYLIHGGFLKAINDYALNKKILPATLAVYSDWIRGDMLKRNKNEVFLREIMTAIIKHHGKQISWINLVKELSIEHTQTVADYISLLESMDAVFVQSAIIEEKLVAAPKKQKKLMFTDPFIFHAINAWLNPVTVPFEEQILAQIQDPILQSNLVESCTTTHFRRYYPTYYIKATGEIDIAYVHNKQFWPVEIKWTNQLRPKELKQISKYSNAVIYSKSHQVRDIQGIPVFPLPEALLDVEEIDTFRG